MQRVAVYDCDHLFEAGNFRCTRVNQHTPKLSNRVDNDYLKCLKKSRKLLKGLERSLIQIREYEDELAKCKQDHAYIHLRNKLSEETINVYPTTTKAVSPKSHSSPSGTPSSISVVEIQYQHKELCERIDSLLREFYNCCQGDVSALHLSRRIHETHAELVLLHKSLMGIAEKYLTLKHKFKLQETRYKDRIVRLQHTLPDLLSAVESKHQEFGARLSQLSRAPHDAAVTLLVAEMSRNNDLLLENIRLKTKLEMLTMD